jgi:hypothetical protein
MVCSYWFWTLVSQTTSVPFKASPENDHGIESPGWLIYLVRQIAMIQIVRLLTAVAIVVHTTVGCCAHGAHGKNDECCKQNDCCTVKQGNHESHGHAYHDQLGAGELSADLPQTLDSSSTCDHQSQQPAPHECRHANCIWTTPEARDNIDLMSLSFEGNIQWSVNTSLVFLLAYGNESPDLLSFFSPHSAPVRVHLIKCVLLI